MVWMTIALALGQATPQVQSAMQAELTSQGIPGATVAVVQDGQIVYSDAFGLRDVEAGTPMTETTRMGIGSIGKTVTATLIGQLVVSGDLAYTDTLGELLPEVGETYAAVTVHDVMTHMSGVPRDYKRGDSFTGKKLFRKLRKSDPEFAAGGGWSYSNTGFILLGEIIERKTGQTLVEAVTERIIAPANMEHAVAIQPGDDPDRALAYERPNGPPAAMFPMRFGAGNLVTTAVDLAHYDIALSSGTLLPLEAQAEQWVPDGPTATIGTAAGEEFTVGRGWFVGSSRGHRSVGHTGSIDGYHAVLERYVDDGVTLVVLTNAEYADLGPLLDVLREAYVWDR